MKVLAWLPRLLAVLVVGALINVNVGYAQTTSAPAFHIKLVMGDGGAEGNSDTRPLSWWMEQVKKSTGGKVEFEPHWLGSLVPGPDVRRAVSEGGIEQVGRIWAHHFPGPTPLWGMKAMPMGYDIRWAYAFEHQLGKTDPRFINELESQGLKYLFPTGGGPFGLMTRKLVVKPGDAKGMKIRTYGAYFGSMIASWGATPVSVAFPEVYAALERGIMDGVLHEPFNCVQQRYYEIASNYLYGIVGYQGGMAVVMNLKVWNKLPTDIQKIMLQEADRAVEWGQSDLQKITQEALTAMTQKGVKVTMPTPEVVKLWREPAFAAATKTWIELGEKFKVKDPGGVLTEIMEKYEKFIK